MPIARGLPLVLLILISGCMPSEIEAQLPAGGTLKLAYYPGGSALDDLLIIEGTNYFGKAQYQFDDPLGDIGFRFNDGQRVQAECTNVGKNIIGDDECKIYTVYRSSFPLLPEGTILPRPDGT